MFNKHSYHPKGLGLVATSRRNIRSGNSYARFFGVANAETKIVKGDADVSDTVSHALAMIKRDAPTVARLAKHLQGGSLQQTCKNIFNFMYWHYQYKIDTPGQEQLRTPTRAWKDRTSGIDCDCYSISVGALLTALNIPFALRIIKMYNKAFYQHIYVVVPKIKGTDLDSHSNYWVIDPVLDTFDKEAPYTDKKDFTMQLAELSGIDSGNQVGREFDGFGTTCEGTLHSYNTRMKNHIVNTRNAIAKNPGIVKGFYNPHKFVTLANHVITNWDNEATREKALALASDVEMGLVDDDLQGLHGILNGDEYGNEIHDYLGNDLDYLEAMSGYNLTGGLGKLQTKKQKLKAAADKIAPAAAKANKTKKGFFTKVKNAGKAVKAAGKNPKALVKKVSSLVKKVNPAAIAIRAAVLASMKLNVGHFAAKLKLAYGSQSEAEKAGFNYAHLVDAKNKIEKMFADILGGDPSKFKQAVITHKQIFHKGSKNAEVMDGLGVVVVAAAAASTVAAAPFLAKIAALLKGILQNPNTKAKLLALAKKVVSKKNGGGESQDNGGGGEGAFQSFTPVNNQADESTTNQGGGNNEYIPPTQNSPSSFEDNTTDANNPSDGKDGFPSGKSNMPLILGGAALAVGTAIAIAMSGKKKSASAVGAVKRSTQVSM